MLQPICLHTLRVALPKSEGKIEGNDTVVIAVAIRMNSLRFLKKVDTMVKKLHSLQAKDHVKVSKIVTLSVTVNLLFYT